MAADIFFNIIVVGESAIQQHCSDPAKNVEREMMTGNSTQRCNDGIVMHNCGTGMFVEGGS